MKETWSFLVAWDADVKWPDRCVKCGRDGPTAHVRLTDTWERGLFWPFCRRVRRATVDAPVCHGCKRPFESEYKHRQRTDLAAAWIAVLLAIALLHWLFDEMFFYLALAVAMFFLIPYTAWIRGRPAPLDISADEDGIEYEFADREYRDAFKDLNEEATVLDTEAYS